MKNAVNSFEIVELSGTTAKTYRDFIIAQKGIFKATITTPLGGLGITMYPSLWKDESSNAYNFEGVITIEGNLSAIGASDTLNQVICRAVAFSDEADAMSFRYSILPIKLSGDDTPIITKTANNAGTFTDALTSDEFSKLALNQAVLKLTYNYLDFLPVILYLSNPLTATVSGTTTIVYTASLPLGINAILMPIIESSDLTKIDMSSMVKDSTPVYDTDNSYQSISDNPLLGFKVDQADTSNLLLPSAFELGTATYANNA